jgi:hypothetical protein
MQQKNIEELIKQIDPESYRMQLVESAKVFKSNWVQFGEHLTKVASDKLYMGWGYKEFEEYCRDEIRIKKATAIKLTNAYFFVTQGDPEIINHSRSKSGLDFDAVNILQKAKNDENCSPEIYEELKNAALEKGQSGPTLARKFKQMIQTEGQTPQKNFQDENLQLVKRLSRRIKPLDTIPGKFKGYLEEMAEYFSTLSSEADSDPQT